MSMQWEFEKCPTSAIHLFSITYTIAIIFSIASCWRFVKHPGAMMFSYVALLDLLFMSFQVG